MKKIFTSDRDRLIVESIIGLAKKLGLKICAEGVETKEQYDFLVGSNCELIQGYYFSKPVPIEELPNVIKQIHCKNHFAGLDEKVVQL